MVILIWNNSIEVFVKCKNLLLITEYYEGESEEEWFGINEKIKYIPLWKWLLKNK